MLNRKKRARIKELRESTETASNQLRKQQSQVNSISRWLERRNDQNGFGVDFEYTLRPKGAK